MPNGDIAHLRTPDDERCWECVKFSEFICDYPDCGRHLCPKHASHGSTRGVQFCTEHYPLALAAHRRRISGSKIVLYDREGKVIKG